MTETAWSSWDEWHVAYSQLYSNSLEDKAEGCNRLKAWTLRGPRLPIPMRDTLAFVEAQLLDHQYHCVPGSSLEQVRLCYSMALVRFVNHAADDGQRGDYAQSIANIAVRIGLPKWLVDVRHESTHQTLPSLQVLRLACAQALQWVEENYWKRQWEEHSKSHATRLDARIAEISDCLSRGALSRNVGPALPPPATAATTSTTTTVNGASALNNNGDAELDGEEGGATTPGINSALTAQDVVESIKEYDAGRIARSIFKVLVSNGEEETEFDWTRWERVFHWLDEGRLRICKPLLMVCISEALRHDEDRGPSQTKRIYALIRGLLSRRYHCETRSSIAKMGSKTVSIDSSESWTKSEQAFMNGYAPVDPLKPQLLAAVTKCLMRPSISSKTLLENILLPCLAKSSSTSASKKKAVGASSQKTSASADEIIDDIQTLFRLRDHMNRLRSGRMETWDGKLDGIDATAGSQSGSLDWEALRTFCDNYGSTSSMKGEGDKTTRSVKYEELQGDGMQEWTKVEWPRLPVGALIYNPKQCPGLSIMPPPRVVMQRDDETPDQQQQPPDNGDMNDSAEVAIGVDVDGKTKQDKEDVAKIVTETSKRIRLLI